MLMSSYLGPASRQLVDRRELAGERRTTGAEIAAS